MADQTSPKEFTNDPVFYGPDGNVLTEEESTFLWNATSCPNDSYYDDDEYVDSNRVKGYNLNYHECLLHQVPFPAKIPRERH